MDAEIPCALFGSFVCNSAHIPLCIWLQFFGLQAKHGLQSTLDGRDKYLCELQSYRQWEELGWFYWEKPCVCQLEYLFPIFTVVFKISCRSCGVGPIDGCLWKFHVLLL